MSAVTPKTAVRTDWKRLRSTAMIWLTAAAVTTALAILVGLITLLLVVGASWFLPADAGFDRTTMTFIADRWQIFLFASPMDGATNAGVLPAIVGTAVLVILMTLMVTPFGVLTAIYLREYARDSWYTQLVRIAIHNLAGVPSIIYGVFGLGFFIYGIGGSLDSLFFAAQLPRPTCGTPGLIWAALTLALLTLPVVIVAAEEGLARIPKDLREASLALGATRTETIFKIVLPAASPSLMTGIILAVARAAGEVAPLMLVGVVKYAPALPVNLRPPFVHLEQKFMHLGFQVYDTAVHASADEGRIGLICATAVLLVLLVLLLNFAAVVLRQRLRDRFQTPVGGI